MFSPLSCLSECQAIAWLKIGYMKSAILLSRSKAELQQAPRHTWKKGNMFPDQRCIIWLFSFNTGIKLTSLTTFCGLSTLCVEFFINPKRLLVTGVFPAFSEEHRTHYWYMYCHTLTLVFFVYLVILVRSGCDMGDVFVFCLSRVFCMFMGLYPFQVQCMSVVAQIGSQLEAASCLSLSLIGNHIQAAIFCGYFVGDCFLCQCLCHTGLFWLFTVRLVFWFIH